MRFDEVPFTEVLSKIVDNRGRTCPTSQSGLPLIATNCIRNESLYPTKEKIRFVDAETYQNWFRGHPEPNDIIFVTKGSPGRVCMTPDPVDFCIAQDMVAVRADESKVDHNYLFAVLRSREIQRQIDNMHVGTMIPHFKKGDFDKLLLPIPDRKSQQFIGRAYRTFCDKIELNRRMNQTLEDTARAIFKSWFVDFDPVRAKMDGKKPVGMYDETAALFPDGFDHTELGLVPKGWRVRSIGDLADIKHGFAFKGEFFRKEATANVLLTPGNFSVGGGFKTDKFKYYDGPIPEGFVLRHGDLLVTMTDLSKMGDTLGFPAIVPKTRSIRFLHNQRLGRIKQKADAGIGRIFLFETLCLPAYRHHVLASASGSTVKHTSPDRIKGFELAVPDQSIATTFEEVASALHARIDANRVDSGTLSTLRDTLLPKLLSGEIRVGEAEKQVEEVV